MHRPSLLALLLLLSLQASAQTWPSRPIRIVAAVSPGGFADVPVRLMAPHLAQALGTSVFVENRPGAGTTIGANSVASSAPDGYNVLVIGAPHYISAWVYKKLPYHAVNDFAPVAMFASGPYVLVVHPSLPVRSLQEFIAAAKAQPGRIDFASSGNGSGQHLVGALLFSMADIQLNHVPYKGSGPAMQDLLAGEVKVLFAGVPNVLSHVRAGRLRPLAVSTARRWPELPDVPPAAEAGVAGYDMPQWLGIAVPARTPADVIQKLYAAIAKSLEGDELQRAFRSSGVDKTLLPPAEFAVFIRKEYETWGRVVRETRVSVD